MLIISFLTLAINTLHSGCLTFQSNISLDQSGHTCCLSNQLEPKVSLFNISAPIGSIRHIHKTIVPHPTQQIILHDITVVLVIYIYLYIDM